MVSNENNELVIRINPVDIIKAQDDGKDIMVNPEAEGAIIRLLAIQSEVDKAVEFLKSEIECQALQFNPNFSAIKGDRLKINYSASGAKYKEDGTAKNHSSKFWKKKVSWSLDSKAIDEYRARRYQLPAGIVEIPRRKTIRLSVSEAVNE